MTDPGWPLLPRDAFPAPVRRVKQAAPRPSRSGGDAGRQLPFFGAETTEPTPADLAGLLAGTGHLGRMGGTARIRVPVDAAWRVHVLMAELVIRGLTATWHPLPPDQDQPPLSVRVGPPPPDKSEPPAFRANTPAPSAPTRTTPLVAAPDPAHPGADLSGGAAVDPVRSGADLSGGAAVDPVRPNADLPGGAAVDPVRPNADLPGGAAPPEGTAPLGTAELSGETVLSGGADSDRAPADPTGSGRREGRPGTAESDPAQPGGPRDGRSGGVESDRAQADRSGVARSGGVESEPERADRQRAAHAGRARAAHATDATRNSDFPPTSAGPRFEVRTAYSRRLNALATAWPEAAGRLFLSGPRLRLWVAAAGEPIPGGYALGLDPGKDSTEIDAALVRAGLAGRVSEDGGRYLITGVRRLARLAELVGERPAAAPAELWPGGAAA